jgi:hypothetical protein
LRKIGEGIKKFFAALKRFGQALVNVAKQLLKVLRTVFIFALKLIKSFFVLFFVFLQGTVGFLFIAEKRFLNNILQEGFGRGSREPTGFDR